MAEYIEREEVYRKLREEPMPWGQRWDAAIEDIVRDIRKIPAADVAPVKHGQWEVAGDGDIQCSNCNMIFTGHEIFPGNFCPCCGSKMDGEGGE